MVGSAHIACMSSSTRVCPVLVFLGDKAAEVGGATEDGQCRATQAPKLTQVSSRCSGGLNDIERHGGVPAAEAKDGQVLRDGWWQCFVK